MFLPLLGAFLARLFRSVTVVVAEERGEHGELAGAPPLVLVAYVAFLQRAAAVGGPYLRRPEEEQARVVPERAAPARRVRLPAGHVRRYRPRERRRGLGRLRGLELYLISSPPAYVAGAPGRALGEVGGWVGGRTD